MTLFVIYLGPRMPLAPRRVALQVSCEHRKWEDGRAESCVFTARVPDDRTGEESA